MDQIFSYKKFTEELKEHAIYDLDLSNFDNYFSDIHNDIKTLENFTNEINRLKKIFRLLFYKIADYHLVYANRSRRLMTESGFNPERIYVVYNSLDFNLHRKFYTEKNPDELVQLKSRLFPDNPELPVIIFIGRLTKEKKLNYLLKAVSISKDKGLNYNCLIVGGGMELENLRNLSSALGINDFVFVFLQLHIFFRFSVLFVSHNLKVGVLQCFFLF